MPSIVDIYHAASNIPIGLPPPRIPRNAGPNSPLPQPLPNRFRIIRRIHIHHLRPRPLSPPPALLHPKAPRTSSNLRRSCAFSSPTATLNGSPSRFIKTCTFGPFRFLCPSIPTPSPFFRLHLRGIHGHLLHSYLTSPRRIPPIQKSLKNLLPDSLLLKFRMPPPSGRIEYRRGLSYP